MATEYTAYAPSSLIKLSSVTVSGSPVQRTWPLLYHVTSQRGHPCPQHSVTVPRSRHMTITATSHIQPTSDAIPAPGCLPTETPHSQETLHLRPSRILLPKHPDYQIPSQCAVVHTDLGTK
ncbi:hypothetical protein PAL_GLEAN10000579 [Pteropus alecto]|uniref:Uncharacterized protein n=1 Tax=Pteropus alecto TaxID=9402 RepID=L5KR45_PTEAL|nr:hypothetical protein PAL_GLEAN10000579 [Pteropus alecto]